jgi:hypothetical protein
MNWGFPLLCLALAASCSAPRAGPEPSLAPRAAEAIDPRIPVADTAPTGAADAALVSQLDQLVREVRAAEPRFEERRARAEQLAAGAGPMASESWVAAQQALSLLVEQYGATTQAAANIDQLAASRLDGQRWIRPADQQAITRASAEVATISQRQGAAIDRMKDQLAR